MGRKKTKTILRCMPEQLEKLRYNSSSEKCCAILREMKREETKQNVNHIRLQAMHHARTQKRTPLRELDPSTLADWFYARHAPPRHPRCSLCLDSREDEGAGRHRSIYGGYPLPSQTRFGSQHGEGFLPIPLSSLNGWRLNARLSNTLKKIGQPQRNGLRINASVSSFKVNSRNISLDYEDTREYSHWIYYLPVLKRIKN